jgi:hypothetical protein
MRTGIVLGRGAENPRRIESGRSRGRCTCGIELVLTRDAQEPRCGRRVADGGERVCS